MTKMTDEFEKRTTPQTHHFQTNKLVAKEVLQYVRGELKQRGAVMYDLWLPETFYLPHVLHKNEKIMGSVYGRYKDGRGALFATDQRVLFIDKKPMYMHVDELTFMIIGGVTFTKTFFKGYVTLHTRLGDYRLRTFNLKNAANFVDFIETECLQQPHDESGKFDAVT